MLHIPGPDAIVHPRTVMIHMRNAAIANATVMTARWFIGLTLGAHGQLLMRRALPQRGDRTGGYTAWIRQGSLNVRRQCQGRQHAVHGRVKDRNALILGQERNGQYRVGNENPDQAGHDGSGRIIAIHPNAVVITGAARTTITQIIEMINVIVKLRRPRCTILREEQGVLPVVFFLRYCGGANGMKVSEYQVAALHESGMPPTTPKRR